jgi:hypothetical protein
VSTLHHRLRQRHPPDDVFFTPESAVCRCSGTGAGGNHKPTPAGDESHVGIHWNGLTQKNGAAPLERGAEGLGLENVQLQVVATDRVEAFGRLHPVLRSGAMSALGLQAADQRAQPSSRVVGVQRPCNHESRSDGRDAGPHGPPCTAHQ